MNVHWTQAIERVNAIARRLGCRVYARTQEFSGVDAAGHLCRLIRGKPCEPYHSSVTPPGCPARGFPILLDHVAILTRAGKPVAITNEPYQLPDDYEPDLDRYCREHGLRWRRTDAVASWNPGQTKAIIIWRADAEGFEDRLSELVGEPIKKEGPKRPPPAKKRTLRKPQIPRAERGWVDSLERWPKNAWNENGIKPAVAKRLEKIASKLCGIKPGRPPKTSTKDFRARTSPLTALVDPAELEKIPIYYEPYEDYEVY